jgi:RimJ/RimL family protein N-acetyltransferase
MQYTVRRVRPDDWQRQRTVRLAALLESPDAFMRTYADESALADAEWQHRVRGAATGPDGSCFLALDDADAVVGMAGGIRRTPSRVVVWGVWVEPAHRGTAVAAELMAAVEEWARDEARAAELMLEVVDGNARAAAFYARLGFLPNGVVKRLREGSDLMERELVKPLVASPAPGYTVRRIQPDDWPTLREVRLAALADAPLAFETTLSTASAYDDTEWQARAALPATSPDTATFLAFDATGAGVGMMRAEVGDDRQRVWLFSVWVAPEHRGGTVATILLDVVTAWARDHIGASELVLEVNERNERAAAFYRRCGFTDTGRARPYANDPSLHEREMVMPLG